MNKELKPKIEPTLEEVKTQNKHTKSLPHFELVLDRTIALFVETSLAGLRAAMQLRRIRPRSFVCLPLP